jgi:methylase of polypeptide subunit release factors
MAHPALAGKDVTRLRDALAAAGYTVDGVRAVLGPVAAAALNRNETTPGRRATSGGSALETLTRLWPLQQPVPLAAASAALPVEPLVAGGLLQWDGETVRAVVDVRPYADDAGDWWVVSDLTPGLDGRLEPVPDDHVLGVNAASSTLAQLTSRDQAGRALDLGTGCGVQALHLARHCDVVIATDVNERALALASATMRLNDLRVDLRGGTWYQPVAGERFDLIVSNPPFVVSPSGHHVYRDGGLAGDEVSRRVVVDGAAHLNDGGRLQALANWMHIDGEDWQDRVGSWAAATGCAAWIIQREVLDPAAYVELWLRDSGDVVRPDYVERYDAWLSWFAAQRATGIGFGWVMLQASGAADPQVRIEDWPHAVAQPLGSAVSAHFDRIAALPATDAELLDTHLIVAPDVVQEQIGQPGAEHPEHVVLRQQSGLRRARTADTAEAGLVGACDGSLSAGVLIGALATVLGVAEDALRSRLVPVIRELVADDFLTPAPPPVP